MQEQNTWHPKTHILSYKDQRLSDLITYDTEGYVPIKQIYNYYNEMLYEL